MTFLTGFPPVEDKNARVLILGSMPSEASLAAEQYYAHPRNVFWPIMESLLGLKPERSYEQRTQALKANGIALWDVIHACRRNGSLDSGIDEASIVPNDFAAFFRQHPHLARVFFNGGMAERCYRRYVLPKLGLARNAPAYHRLPSTSPAHASWTHERKRKAWEIIARYGREKGKDL